MVVRATSDWHGVLPEVEPCDLLIIAGDVCPLSNHARTFQYSWLNNEFADHLNSLPAEQIVLIGGNHDFELEDYKTGREIPVENLTYLRDSVYVWEGLKFYGIPWVPNLPRWAFHASADRLKQLYAAVPDDTDVLITHGPPFYCGDFTSPRFGSEHVGCKAVNVAINRVQPRLTICGHIHESHGLHYCGGSPMFNVALLDDNYRQVYKVEDVTEYVFPD